MCSGVGNNSEQILKNILRCIQTNNVSNLKIFLKLYIKKRREAQELIVNSRIINVDSYNINVLSYALVTGAHRSFKYLYEHCGCSIEIMNQDFENYSMDALNIICEKNHFELAKYFLPIYFQYKKERSIHVDSTLDFQDISILKEHNEMFTPIQVACYNGCIGLVDYLYQYSKSNYNALIDVKELNEYTGENCALISVRSGSLAMVKMIYENYKLDFHIKNKFGEGALQICAVCCTKFPTKSFSEVFMYLLDVIGVNFIDNHEEILLVLEDKALIIQCEQLLSEKGIMVTKGELEQIFKVRKNFNLNLYEDPARMNIKEALDTSSYISSIAHYESNETPFAVDSFMNCKV